MTGAFHRTVTNSDGSPDESSNSFALMVVLLPIILGMFGIGVDVSRNVYVRNSIQNSLDNAVVGGAGVTRVGDSGEVVLDGDNSLATVERIYAIDRAAGPGLRCIGGGSKCWKQPVAPRVTDKLINYTVAEQTTNSFLPILGVRYQDYELTSTAIVNQRTE